MERKYFLSTQKMLHTKILISGLAGWERTLGLNIFSFLVPIHIKQYEIRKFFELSLLQYLPQTPVRGTETLPQNYDTKTK